MKKQSKGNTATKAADQILANGKINKSELIRGYAKENSGAKPSEIATALAAQTGHAFAPQLVSQVLHKVKAPSKKRAKAATIGQTEFAVMVQVKAFADKIGGFEVLKNATAALDKLLAP